MNQSKYKLYSSKAEKGKDFYQSRLKMKQSCTIAQTLQNKLYDQCCEMLAVFVQTSNKNIIINHNILKLEY